MFDMVPFKRRSGEMATPSEKYFDPFSVHIMNDSLEMNEVGFRTDVKETPEEYILEAELPGLDKDEIDLTIEGGCLSIATEKREEVEERANYIHRERRVSRYKRTFPIKNVIEDEIEAEYDNGILKVTVPKEEKEVCCHVP